MLEQIIGKKSADISEEEMANRLQKHEKLCIDLGTGDGLFVWRKAREACQENNLWLGLDAARESLQEGSARAAKKTARGGAPNAQFFCMNVLEMPAFFENKADYVCINFPWGSLLQAVALPDEAYIEQVAKLAKKGGVVEVYINLQVFQDETRRENLGLNELDEEVFAQKIKPIYEKFGLKVQNHLFIPSGQKVDVASTWGGRLTRGGKRPTLYFSMVKE